MKDLIVQKTALKRLTDSMEMAKVIVFAASDLASYMAGTTYTLNWISFQINR